MERQGTFNDYVDGERTLTMDEDGYREWVEQHDFSFASSSAERGSPHEYLNRYDLPKSENRTFFEFVIYIRANGYDMEFQGNDYRVCEIGDYLYWTDGASVGETFILNRKPLDGYEEYDEAERPTDGFNEV